MKERPAISGIVLLAAIRAVFLAGTPNFSYLPDGSYSIQGLPIGSYVVGAEPLDGPVSNSDVSGYPKALGQPSVNTNFTSRLH